MATQENLWPVYQVQSLDAKLAVLERTRASLDDGASLGHVAMQQRAAVEAYREEARKAAQAVRDAEFELAAVEEKLKRIQGILYGGKVTNPKELQGYEGELASLRRRKDVLEDQALALMEAREEADGSVAAAESVEAEARAAYQAHIAKLREQITALDAEKAALLAERDARRAAADPELLRAYDQAVRQRRHLVGRVEQDACSACGMVLPGRLIKEYKASPDAELSCPTCGALLLWRVPEE